MKNLYTGMMTLSIFHGLSKMYFYQKEIKIAYLLKMEVILVRFLRLMVKLQNFACKFIS